jgi:Peptidase family C69
VGAGLFASPYRPRPLEWEYDGVRYHNERNVATPKTGWNFIAQLRSWMPPPLAVVLWFACDDSSTAPRTPVYTSSTRLSSAYYGRGPQDGVVSPIMVWDPTKAFWIQNQVSNWVYFRYADAYPVLQEKLHTLQKDLMNQVAIADERALQAYYNSDDKDGPVRAVEFVTLFTVNAGNTVHRVWQDFYGQLFVRFRDFYTILPQPDDPACGCQANEPGLSEVMKKRIVEGRNGAHYKMIENNILETGSD